MGDRIAAIIGSLLGIAIAGYFFVYLPMSRNYAACGKVTLCQPDQYHHHKSREASDG